MTEVITWITENWLLISTVAAHVVAIAAAIAAVTKTETDNKVVAFLRKVLDVLALNVGKAKNAK